MREQIRISLENLRFRKNEGGKVYIDGLYSGNIKLIIECIWDIKMFDLNLNDRLFFFTGYLVDRQSTILCIGYCKTS
jgi:hypothetical protein